MEKSFPLNDTEYLADDLQMWFAGRTHGVLSMEDNLSVIPREGMKISMSAGHAFLKTGSPNKGGIMYYNENSKDFVVDVADSILDRIDSVVIRYDKVQNTISAYLKKGIPGSTPAAYVPIRDAEAFELVIAEINVQHGIGAITASLIKDTRMDEQKCGLVRDNIERIPTQVLYDQFQEFMDTNKSEFDDILETARNDYEEIKKDSEDQIKIVSDKIEELDNMVMNGDFDGASILSGLDDPMDDIGKDKDLYINETSLHLFLKEGGTWVDKGSLRGTDGNNKVLMGPDAQNATSETLLLKTQGAIESTDHISLDALLNAAGDAAVASDTAIIKHEDQNLKDFINKRIYKAPEGYEVTDNGIILLRDIDVGTIECTGWYYCVDCTGLPISESCYMEVKVHPTSTYHATQHFISATTGNEFKRNKSGGIWGRWLLTAGEVLLWSGSVQEVNSEINLLHNKDMFGTLAVTISGIKISASNSADLIPFVTLFNYRTDKTALIKTAIFTVVNSKKLTLFSSSGQINFNYASNSDFVKLPVTAIYGRP